MKSLRTLLFLVVAACGPDALPSSGSSDAGALSTLPDLAPAPVSASDGAAPAAPGERRDGAINLDVLATSMDAAALADAAASRPDAPLPPTGDLTKWVLTLRPGSSATLDVHDIGANHALVKSVVLPMGPNSKQKGIAAHAETNRLYVTGQSGDLLAAYDLASVAQGSTATLIYAKRLTSWCPYTDSLSVTRDGKHLYIPCRKGKRAAVFNAADGTFVTALDMSERDAVPQNDPNNPFSSPHNSWAGTKHVFVAALANPLLYVFDAATHKEVKRIGPFLYKGREEGVRPFTVAEDESRVFVNVHGLLGFAIADVATGKVTGVYENKTPADRLGNCTSQYHLTPSHGIAMRPNSTEIWVSNDACGYLHVWDVGQTPPRMVADVPVFSNPSQRVQQGWVTFDIDGKYAYSSAGPVIDADQKKRVAAISTSEFRLVVHFRGGRPVAAGRRMY